MKSLKITVIGWIFMFSSLGESEDFCMSNSLHSFTFESCFPSFYQGELISDGVPW